MAKIGDVSQVLLLLGLPDATENQRSLASWALEAAEGAVIRYLKYDPKQAVRTEYYPNMDFDLQGRTAVWEIDDQQAFVRQLSESAVDELQVKHLPVREFDVDGGNQIDLRIDYDGRSGTRPTSFGVEDQKTEGTDFWPNYNTIDSSGNKVCDDGIIRSQGRWPSIAGSVKITYLGGYTDQELNGQDPNLNAYPILEAVIDEAVRRVKKIASRQITARKGLATGPLTSENLGEYSYTQDSDTLRKLLGADASLLQETQIKLHEFVNWGVMLAS